jgi:hypothetical protein
VQGSGILFDHLIGIDDKALRDGNVERLGGFEVDEHLELRRLVDREVCRLLAFQDATGIGANDVIRFVQ